MVHPTSRISWLLPPFCQDALCQKVQYVWCVGRDFKGILGTIDSFLGPRRLQNPHFHLAADDKVVGGHGMQVSGSHYPWFRMQDVDAFTTHSQTMNRASVVVKNRRDWRIGYSSWTFSDMWALKYSCCSRINLILHRGVQGVTRSLISVKHHHCLCFLICGGKFFGSVWGHCV